MCDKKIHGLCEWKEDTRIVRVKKKILGLCEWKEDTRIVRVKKKILGSWIVRVKRRYSDCSCEKKIHVLCVNEVFKDWITESYRLIEWVCGLHGRY